MCISFYLFCCVILLYCLLCCYYCYYCSYPTPALPYSLPSNLRAGGWAFSLTVPPLLPLFLFFFSSSASSLLPPTCSLSLSLLLLLSLLPFYLSSSLYLPFRYCTLLCSATSNSIRTRLSHLVHLTSTVCSITDWKPCAILQPSWLLPARPLAVLSSLFQNDDHGMFISLLRACGCVIRWLCFLTAFLFTLRIYVSVTSTVLAARLGVVPLVISTSVR